MRLDKYLKVSRLVKRRTVAKVMADRERFMINGRTAKPASDVKVNDQIDLFLGKHHLKIKVVEVKEIVPADKAKNLYEVLTDEMVEEEAK